MDREDGVRLRVPGPVEGAEIEYDDPVPSVSSPLAQTVKPSVMGVLICLMVALSWFTD